jgi:hypothetical protein
MVAAASRAFASLSALMNVVQLAADAASIDATTPRAPARSVA